MSKFNENKKRVVDEASEGSDQMNSGNDIRWLEARRRYAALWQDAVLQDWFTLFVYRSEDSTHLREIDVASEQVELAKAVAEASGRVVCPQDLLIGLGSRMGSLHVPNDPEVWAAIDAGQFVSSAHFGSADRRMGWKQKNLLIAATSIVILCAHPGVRKMTCGGSGLVESDTDEMPKSSLLAHYMTWIAAGDCYADDGHAMDAKVLTARFCEEHELTWLTITHMAEIAQAKPANWARGPLGTFTIASLAGDLMVEGYRRTAIPAITPIGLQRPGGAIGRRKVA